MRLSHIIHITVWKDFIRFCCCSTAVVKYFLWDEWDLIFHSLDVFRWGSVAAIARVKAGILYVELVVMTLAPSRHIIQWLGEQRQTRMMLSLTHQRSDQKEIPVFYPSQCCTIARWFSPFFFLWWPPYTLAQNATKIKEKGKTFAWKEITPEE